MPLKGSEAALATELKKVMKSVKNYDEAWEKMASIVLTHIVNNAVAVGTCPSGGGALTAGKIQ
jgi:hypothetical protein